MSEDDFYPILVPHEPIRVTFVVPMSKKTFAVWLQRYEPGGREQEDRRLLKEMGYPIEPKETLGLEVGPPVIVKYSHVDFDGQILEEKDIYESYVFSSYSLADGWSIVEAVCFGSFIRLPFDQLLVRIGTHFAESRAGLCESVRKEEVQRMLPLLARKCTEWVPEVTSEEQQRKQIPSWFPRKELTLQKWARAFYEGIEKTRTEYVESYENLELDNPNPSLAFRMR